MAQTKIILSNNGLKDMLDTTPIYILDIGVNEDQSGITLKILNKNASLAGDEPLLNNTDFSTVDVNQYINKLLKVAEFNKIKDTDKVYFSKNSTFPRTAFNRYSDKARRVEKHTNADKVIISKSLYLWRSSISIYRVQYTDKNDVVKQFYCKLDLNTLVNYISNSTGNIVTTLNSFTYQRNWTKILTDDLKALLIPLIDEKLESKVTSIGITTRNILRTSDKKDSATLQLLFSGEIPISKISTDTVANTYIDKFRGDLDKQMYDYLLQALSAEKADPEVPMQLLAQLSIEKDSLLLYALILALPSKAMTKLANHKVMNTVDVKNFIKSYKLKNFIINYGYQDHRKYTLIGDVMRKQINDDKRKEFFNLLKDQITELVSNITDIPSNTLTITYEST